MVREHMPNRIPNYFKKSLIAAAILSLTGCASSGPKMEEVDLSPIGEGILVAGRATAEVGIHAWDVSMYLLGFSEDVGEDVKSDTDNELVELADKPYPMDEVDMAMLDDGELLAEDSLNPVEINNASVEFDSLNEAPAVDDFSIFEQTSEAEPLLIEPDFGNEELLDPAQAELQPVEMIQEEATAQATIGANPQGQDHIYTVATSETLWDIAKATTGDATNWHTLADVNDLNQNAGVFAGQSLIIPASLLKPDYLASINGASDETLLAGNTDLILPTETNGSTQDIAVASAQSGSTRLAIPSASELPGTTIKLNTGETLWDFAKRTTGDATNWKAIASHNEFSDSQAVVVRAGQSISVPQDLIKPDVVLASAKPVARPPISKEAKAEVLAAIEKVNQSAINASSELLTEATSLGNAQPMADETQPITIVEANFQTDPSTQTMKIESDKIEVVKMTTVSPDLNQIMISGTYYPKAIYNDADFSSSLLMRVSPGTSLKVSKAVGNWFEVETDKGTGYVHQRDIK